MQSVVYDFVFHTHTCESKSIVNLVLVPVLQFFFCVLENHGVPSVMLVVSSEFEFEA